MNFSEKLKELRKTKNMSQEQLAEKLYVSRQAITKWENGTGLPDIANLIAISALFNESLDNLLSEEKSLMVQHEFLYESLTQYDLEEEKSFDINFGTAREVILEAGKSEKIEVIAASNKIAGIEQLVKVKIDENRRFMDVDVKHSSELTDSNAKNDLILIFRIPSCFMACVELTGNAEVLKVRDISLDNLEYGGKLKKGVISNASGHFELDTNSDLEFEVKDFKGKIDFNQFKATSVLKVINGNYYLRRLGMKNRFVDENQKEIELSKSKRQDDLTTEEFKKYDFIVEIAGWKSEVKIVK